MKQSTRVGLIGLGVSVALFAAACSSNDDSKKTVTPAASGAATATAAPPTSAASSSPSASGAATTTTGAASSYTPRKVASSVTVQGAGATFPAPFYTKAFDQYNKTVDSNVKVNYQSIGSGGGVKNFTEKTVDMGATDAFMTAEQITAAGGADNVVQIPTVLGAIVLTYNIPGFNGSIKLSPDTLSGIYLGEIKKWNDPKIKNENAGANLPDAEIATIYRSDGSGTTFNFTTYLSQVSDKWKSGPGAGTTVKWPTGIGAQGNDGVAGQIKQTPGSIGYVELIYAEQTKLPTAELKNKNGKYVKASLAATAAAAADPSAFKDDLNANLLDQAGDTTYPIVTATWLILNRSYSNETTGQAIVNLVWWMTHSDGQAVAEGLQYAKLPAAVVTKLEAKLKTITAAGKPVIS